MPFCVDGSWASGVRVERDGAGLGEVWSRQITQLNRVSSAVASTLTTAYPSPQILLQVGVDLRVCLVRIIMTYNKTLCGGHKCLR